MAPYKKYAVPAISPEKMSYGLLGGIFLIWLLSLIVSISSLFSLTYIRLRTDLIRRNIIPASCQPVAFNDYELVHIDCPIRTYSSFIIPKPFEHNIDRADLKSAVFFDMTLEMFQNGKWYDHIVGSSLLIDSGSSTLRKHASVKTHPYFPYLDGIGRQFSNEVYAGNYLLDKSLIPTLFVSRRPLRLIDDGTFVPDGNQPPLKITNRNTHVFDNSIYTSVDPLRPSEGDLRIRFYVSSATHVSAIGVQTPISSTGLKALLRWLDHGLSGIVNGETIRKLSSFDDSYLSAAYNGTLGKSAGSGARVIISEGDYNADQLLSLYEKSNNAFHPIHWYALGFFGLLSTILIWALFKRFGQANFGSVPLSFIVGTFMTFGSVLLVASIPNIILRTTWRLGVLQLLAGATSLFMAWWSYMRAPELYHNSCLNYCNPYTSGYVELRPAQNRVEEVTEINEVPTAYTSHNSTPCVKSNKVYAAV